MNTIYLFPGIGCTCAVFEKMRFPAAYRVHRVEWIEPQQGEDLARYCARMTQGLEFDASDLLVGVSFGGIVVQEIARQYPILERIVVLSSAVSVAEYPGFVRFLRALKFYRLLPGGIFRNRQLRAYLVTGQRGEKGVRSVDRFFAPLSERYFRFAIRACMEFPAADASQIRRMRRIHGHRDALFPIRRLVSPVEDIAGATLLMVYTHAREVSRVLARVIRGPWYR